MLGAISSDAHVWAWISTAECKVFWQLHAIRGSLNKRKSHHKIVKQLYNEVMTFMRLEDVPDSKSLRKPHSWSRKVH